MSFDNGLTRVTVEAVGSGWIQLYFEVASTRFSVGLDAGGKSKRIKDDFKFLAQRLDR